MYMPILTAHNIQKYIQKTLIYKIVLSFISYRLNSLFISYHISYQHKDIMDEIQCTFKDIKSKNKNEQENDSIKKEKVLIKYTELDHNELVKLTKEAIHNIIESDPLLSGLPTDVTIEELKAQIAVAQGQAITLYLNRGELPKLGIVVIL
ncbi:uncharacterized protein LOC105735824, partial [Apis florea]|uniref:uncharacterized protein LOC105735824 n=1 Tax=Apis florea TaxID=7463 RepID=UPI0012FEEB28